jgi:hypothetical protein
MKPEEDLENPTELTKLLRSFLNQEKSKTPLTDAHQKATAGMVGLECSEVYDFARNLERQMWEYYSALEYIAEGTPCHECGGIDQQQIAVEALSSANVRDHRCSPEDKPLPRRLATPAINVNK